MARRVCGACGAKNDLGAVVCSKCGAALKKKRKPPLRPVRKAGQGGALYTLLDLFPGVTRAPAAIGTAVGLVATAALVYLTLRPLPTTFLTGLLALVCYVTSLTWLLYGYVVVPWEAVVVFDGRKWLALIALTVVPVAIVAGLLPGV
jgi:ribosomal protein L40E